MTWQIEAFRNSDEWLEWDLDLVHADRATLERELGFSMPTPDCYPLHAEEVIRLFKYASDEVSAKDTDEERLAFFLTPIADYTGQLYTEPGYLE